jgi:hypothetical protein
MNVEKLRKVNALTETLRKQGIVANTEDAVALAADIAGSYEEQQFSQVQVDDEQKIVIRDQTSGDVLIEEPVLEDTTEEIPVEQDTFTREEVINVLQSFADQFIKEVEKVSKRVSEQSTTIAHLQKKLDNLRVVKPQVQPMPVQQQEQPQTEEEGSIQHTLNVLGTNPSPEPVQAAVEEVKPQTTQETSNPRSGNYTADDVSIEKIFYFGQT